MIQIALECSGRQGSISVLDREKGLWDRPLGVESSTAAEIGPVLKAALEWCESRAENPRFVSVAVGPGSFTGIRIAVTAAKTLAFALDLPVVSVGSLTAIAAATHLPRPTRRILVGLNAFRNQVFVNRFQAEQLRLPDALHRCNHEVETVSRSQWDAMVQQALESPEEAISSDPTILSESAKSAVANRERVDAVGVGRVAWGLLSGNPQQLGNPAESAVLEDAFSLAARYVKLSAAEEKAAER